MTKRNKIVIAVFSILGAALIVLSAVLLAEVLSGPPELVPLVSAIESI